MTANFSQNFVGEIKICQASFYCRVVTRIITVTGPNLKNLNCCRGGLEDSFW